MRIIFLKDDATAVPVDPSAFPELLKQMQAVVKGKQPSVASQPSATASSSASASAHVGNGDEKMSAIKNFVAPAQRNPDDVFLLLTVNDRDHYLIETPDIFALLAKLERESHFSETPAVPALHTALGQAGNDMPKLKKGMPKGVSLKTIKWRDIDCKGKKSWTLPLGVLFHFEALEATAFNAAAITMFESVFGSTWEVIKSARTMDIIRRHTGRLFSTFFGTWIASAKAQDNVSWRISSEGGQVILAASAVIDTLAHVIDWTVIMGKKGANYDAPKRGKRFVFELVVMVVSAILFLVFLEYLGPGGTLCGMLGMGYLVAELGDRLLRYSDGISTNGIGKAFIAASMPAAMGSVENFGWPITAILSGASFFAGGALADWHYFCMKEIAEIRSLGEELMRLLNTEMVKTGLQQLTIQGPEVVLQSEPVVPDAKNMSVGVPQGVQQPLLATKKKMTERTEKVVDIIEAIDRLLQKMKEKAILGYADTDSLPSEVRSCLKLSPG